MVFNVVNAGRSQPGMIVGAIIVLTTAVAACCRGDNDS